MRILLTNDDGYRSAGIRALFSALHAAGHSVWIVAPHKNRSACSHSLTITMPLRLMEHDKNIFSCSGTTADCVILAMSRAIPTDFDGIISGINYGPNLGADIVYSGTVAGARQGAMLGVPSMAVSLYCHDGDCPIYFKSAARFMATQCAHLFELCNISSMLNINIPNIEREEYETHFVEPGYRLYHDTISEYSPPNDAARYFFIRAEPNTDDPKPHGDLHTVMDEKIAVSVLAVHPTHVTPTHVDLAMKGA